MMMLKKEKPVMPVSVLIHGTQRSWNQPGSNDLVMSSVGRQSPLDVTSPSSYTNNGAPTSPSICSTSSNANSYIANSSPGSTSTNISGSSFSPTHPLSGSKHLCSICGDKASGKHYGVYSCEGCKGFFKRTVRKELVYSCREKRECIIDKRQRNRCQYCRYRKCLNMGMKREAVQVHQGEKENEQADDDECFQKEERQRTKMEKIEVPDLNQLNGTISDMPVSQILEAELMTDPDNLMLIDQKPDLTNYFPAAKDQMEQMVLWAKHIPHFRTLPLEDQMVLLKQGWNELLIVTFSHRSINTDGAIILSNGIRVDRSTMQDYGLDAIFDRVLSELVHKMRQLQMDKTELGCLKTIVLFNSEAKNLCCTNKVEMLREKVYVALEEYTKATYPEQAGRFPKLLLRMPALRSIALKCTDNLFFLKDWQNYPKIIDTPIDKYLLNLLSEERSSSAINLNS